jgi:hypothetical protein
VADRFGGKDVFVLAGTIDVLEDVEQARRQ